MYYRAYLEWNIWNHKPEMTPTYNAVQVASGNSIKEVKDRAMSQFKGSRADKMTIYVYESPESQTFVSSVEY